MSFARDVFRVDPSAVEDMGYMRCLEGEEQAAGEVDLASVLEGMYSAVEIVALGFHKVDEATGMPSVDLDWEFLENVSVRPGVTFEITGEEIRDVLKRRGRKPVVLWHSHYVSAEPSETDVQMFPEWLVNVGVVYCARTGTSSLYDADGVISPLNTATTPSLPSKDITDGVEA